MNNMRKEKGFTLIELVIVIIIIVILAFTVFPATKNALKDNQLNACAQEIASHLRYGRTVAMGNGRIVRFNFKDGSPALLHEYVVESFSPLDALCATPADIANPLNPGERFEIVLSTPGGFGMPRSSGPEFRGITFQPINFTSTNVPTSKILVFDPNGAPFNDCGISNSNNSFNNTGVIRIQDGRGRIMSLYLDRYNGSVMVDGPS